MKLPGLGTVSRLLGMAVFTTWAAATFLRGRSRRPAGFHGVFLVLVGWVGWSVFWSLDAAATSARLVTYVQLFLFSLIVWDLCDSRQGIQRAMQALVLGLWLNVANGYWNFARGIEAEYGRFSSSGSDANEAALLVAIGIPIALYLALQPSARSMRIVNMTYLPAAIVAIALSGSRTVLVAGVAVVAYIFVIVRQMRPSALVATMLLLVGGFTAISVLVPEQAVERSTGVGTDLSEGELSGRLEIWSESIEVFIEHPFVGVGSGATRAAIPTGKVAHNVLITMAVELGLVGLALWIVLGFHVARAVMHLPRFDRQLWLAVLCTWGMGSLTLAIDTRKYTWLVLSLAVTAAATAAEHRTQPAWSASGARRRPEEGERPLAPLAAHDSEAAEFYRLP